MQDLAADYRNNRYIPLFILKVLNCLMNLDEKLKNLTHLVNIESNKYYVKY